VFSARPCRSYLRNFSPPLQKIITIDSPSRAFLSDDRKQQAISP
jgi:hypothetical protein